MHTMTDPYLRVSDAYERMIYLLKSGASRAEVEAAHSVYVEAEKVYRETIPQTVPLELA
jgi:hypothetical protein